MQIFGNASRELVSPPIDSLLCALPQMLRDRPLELDGSLDTLAEASSGALHDDAIRLGTVFRSIRDGVLGAPGPAEVDASAAAGQAQLQAPAVQAAVAHVESVRAGSCG